MPIVDGLLAVVREACAVAAEKKGLPGMAKDIRRGTTGRWDGGYMAQAALDAIRKYFKDYEEVGVDERCTDRGGTIYTDPKARIDAAWSHDWSRTLSILIPKPAPEMRTVSREALAVMRETIRDIPYKGQSVRDALAEADKVL